MPQLPQLPQQLPALVLRWTASPAEAEIAEAVALLAAAQESDGVAPISDAASLRLRHSARGDSGLGDSGRGHSAQHLLARIPSGALVAYAGVDGRAARRTAEFVVHPDYRRRGIGATVLAALLDRVSGPLWVWAHGEHPGALRLAAQAGLRRRRELLQLRRALADPLPSWSLPDPLRLRTFVPGRDEAAVVRLNNRAFDWHPEQGHWGVDELVLRESEAWFDPQGFLLAVDDQDRLHGFHWTKVHSRDLGEVYVIAVDPDSQGMGLGGALLVAGLRYLHRLGLAEVMLYVESDNSDALRTYRKLGFVPYRTDVEFLRA